MKINKKIMILIVVVILITGVIWVKGFLSVDSCLDSGGRWSDEMKTCEQ
jgi:hypothetical protein